MSITTVTVFIIVLIITIHWSNIQYALPFGCQIHTETKHLNHGSVHRHFCNPMNLTNMNNSMTVVFDKLVIDKLGDCLSCWFIWHVVTWSVCVTHRIFSVASCRIRTVSHYWHSEIEILAILFDSDCHCQQSIIPQTCCCSYVDIRANRAFSENLILKQKWL